MKLSCPLILASRSPRRKKLLEQFGATFTVIVGQEEEALPPPGAVPHEVVQQLALQKAEVIAAANPDALTLGADTIVVRDGSILNKPRDEVEAYRMLRSLSGNTHTVYTGIALIHPTTSRRVSSHERTEVTFAHMTDREIADYVATGSPMDKAGAYGIQDDRGALFIARIDGDYYNVVGLPLHRLYRILQEQFADLCIDPTPVSG
jgi:septum formation protein